MTKPENISNLTEAKELIASLQKELEQTKKGWEELAVSFEEEVKRRAEERLTELTNEKKILEEKIKVLESQKGENKEEKSIEDIWEQVKTPVIYLGGLLFVLLVWTGLTKKLFGK